MQNSSGETREIEVRFLDIDKEKLVEKLKSLGATDKGEVMLEEVIVYDKEEKWMNEKRFVRIRKSGDTTTMVYKEHMPDATDDATNGAIEVEFQIGDLEKAILFLEKIGLNPYRRQQKKRHTFELDGVTLDIDTWPRIPTYVEFEGPSMGVLQSLAAKLGFDWSTVMYEDPRYVIEKIYGIPIGSMRWFTFDRFE